MIPAAFSFGAPAVLFGLLALPVIWWLLRLTPPRPQTELFPPLRILARILKSEETPHQSPWWLTLLRLIMAALVIFALAAPVFNPREKLLNGQQTLAIVIDNGWSSAPEWDRISATAERLITEAADSGSAVVLALATDRPNTEIGPFEAAEALDRLRASEPRSVPVDRRAIYSRVGEALQASSGAAIAILTDGLKSPGDDAAFDALLAAAPAELIWIEPERFPAIGLTAIDSEPDALAITAIRKDTDSTPRSVVAGAFDDRGRRIADATLQFGPGETRSQARFTVPFELRNDFSSIRIDGENQAAATRLLDENSRRRRVGLISASEADQGQPLLSPLYYISRALTPFANLIEPDTADLAKAIPGLLEQMPAIIVMADVGRIPQSATTELEDWVEAGGTLVRFAGPRLAASPGESELLPVKLRFGERSLGGALSWTEPQAVSEFPVSGPFSDLTPPRDVFVVRQVLAEPTSDIVDRTWANLSDGTPLVTGNSLGKGTLVLFHVTPEATWSNLPISGSFVEMLRRIVQVSRNQGNIVYGQEGVRQTLPPYRSVAADGSLVPPLPGAKPLAIAAGAIPVSIDNPPGLYGTEEGLVAHNLLTADAAFDGITRPQTELTVREASYAFDESVDLKGPLIAAALLLMVLDIVAVFWMGGVFSAVMRRAAPSSAGTLAAFLLVSAFLGFAAPPAGAQDSKPGDTDAIEAISVTRLAYVKTGDDQVDSISRAGLAGITRFLRNKTALEPGEPRSVDIATDELAFYPIIYWPVNPDVALPSDAAIARIDAYMQQGGTVLFDTRDQYSSGFGASAGASPSTRRLREILSSLNIPPLEPVPTDHVLTKSFYILEEFPGRYRGSPLWVAASLGAENREDRPVRTGDGVSPIMITANDFAGAWAIDENGNPLLPTVPQDPLQRTFAMRAGVNIMMYMLTGNYKSDQVHIPILLERLGQ